MNDQRSSNNSQQQRPRQQGQQRSSSSASQNNRPRQNPRPGQQNSTASHQGSGQSPTQNGHHKRRNRRNRNRRPGQAGAAQNPRNQTAEARSLHRGPLPNSERRPPYLDRAFEKYVNLLDQHLIARRKYFELFYRADHLQKAKLERHFYQTLFDVRDFEAKCTDEVRDYLLKKTNGKSEDFIYSDNHQLEKIGKVEVEGDRFEDPHLLQSQIKADFKDDTEESVGSMEDYLKYKGL